VPEYSEKHGHGLNQVALTAGIGAVNDLAFDYAEFVGKLANIVLIQLRIFGFYGSSL